MTSATKYPGAKRNETVNSMSLGREDGSNNVSLQTPGANMKHKSEPWRSSGVYHAQVVHQAGPVLPDLRRGAAERLHSDFLTAVQLPHRPHHHMHRIEHQR